jgi:hypothetical protein
MSAYPTSLGEVSQPQWQHPQTYPERLFNLQGSASQHKNKRPPKSIFSGGVSKLQRRPFKHSGVELLRGRPLTQFHGPFSDLCGRKLNPQLGCLSIPQGRPPQPSQGRQSSPTGWPPSPSRAIAPVGRPHGPSFRWPHNLWGSPRNHSCNH